jgi:phosphoribosyl 1,2-cyclic phosphodiesterase
MTLSVRNFGSGSSGNAVLVEANGAALLVDCGIGKRALVAGLASCGRTLDGLAAVLVTHEHADHVRALPDLARAGVPVVATERTLRALADDAEGAEVVRAGRPLTVARMEVTALPVSHDAVEPCGYTIAAAGRRITVLTDLGTADPALAEVIAASDLVILEANHDELMLRAGPYPAHLKRRVLSASGHLSNADCGQLLAAALGPSARRPTVWLAHLSRTNNLADLAETAVRDALQAAGVVVPVAAMARSGHAQVWHAGKPAPVQLRLGF